MSQGEFAGGRIRALDVEIEIKALENDNTMAPIWVKNLNEAIRWVSEVTAEIFDKALKGEVRLGNEFAGPVSFDQFLTVFAVPSQQNKEYIRDQINTLKAQLENALSVKFGRASTRPIVRITPDSNFFNAHPHAQPGGGGVGQVTAGGVTVIQPQPQQPHMTYPPPYGYPPSPPIIIVPPPNNGEKKNEEKNGGPKGPLSPYVPFIWVLIGALIVGMLALWTWNGRLRADLEAMREKNAQLENQTADLDSRLAFQREQCTFQTERLNDQLEEAAAQVRACAARPVPQRFAEPTF